MDKPTLPTAFGTRDGVGIIYDDKAEAQSRQDVGEGGAGWQSLSRTQAVPPLLSVTRWPLEAEAQASAFRETLQRLGQGAEPSGRAGKWVARGGWGPESAPLSQRPGKLIMCSYNHSTCKPCACVSHTCPKVHHAPTRHNCWLTAWRGPREEPETASTEASLGGRAAPLIHGTGAPL